MKHVKIIVVKTRSSHLQIRQKIEKLLFRRKNEAEKVQNEKKNVAQEMEKVAKNDKKIGESYYVLPQCFVKKKHFSS